MSRAIDPAQPVLSDSGIPYSPRYDDVYHSVEGGLGQAHHVFLGGNRLPMAWQGRRQFVILETGFGQGLNFLATWQAWRADPRRCARLHFVSIEKHPFTREGLDALHAGLGELAPLAACLREDWPPAVPGLHRLTFEGGAVTLTLALGDVEHMLPRLRLGADAFYLDGFSPSHNADMWSPQVMKQLARLARPGATLATYTAAGFVRRGLRDAGFSVSKVPGYGSKRDMTVAQMPAERRRRNAPPLPAPWPERHAMVIGAGLAGCAMAERLAARGWRVTLIESHPGPARETSAHRAAAMHPHLTADDNVLSRLSRAGNLYSLRAWQALAQAGHPVGWRECGVLQIGESDADSESQRQALAALAPPTDFARWMEADEAARAHGADVPRGGLWFPRGGWAAPPDICWAQLAVAGEAVEATFGVRVDSLRHDGTQWLACDDKGAVIASAPVTILANAHAASALLGQEYQPIRRVRGQLTTLRAADIAALGRWPDCVVTGGGYLLPVDAEGNARVGSSYEPDVGPLIPATQTHAENLARLGRLLPALADRATALDPGQLDGFVGVRSVSHNRLPWVGAVPDEAACRARAATLRGAHLRDLPRRPGLYVSVALASRGLTWAALAAELLASQIEAEPLPLEGDLVDALDPGRLVLRALRHGDVGTAASQDAVTATVAT